MNKEQKQYVKILGFLGYILLIMTSLLNAIFDHSTAAQIAPVVLIGTPLVVGFFYLGKKKDNQT